MTATWDLSNPEDIICVVGANGKSQTIHGRSVEETQGRIAKVMVSEFRMSQPEADEFAKMAAEQRGKPSDLEKARSDLASAKATIQSLDTRSQKLEGLLADAEKERDAARAERDKAVSDLAAAKAALQQAEARLKAANPPPSPPTPPKEDTSGQAEKPAT